MSAPRHLDSEAPIDLAALADRFVACFPKLNAEERKIFVALYRLLALGEPVPPLQIALRAGAAVHQVNALLDAVPAVYREDGKVIGFWGLTLRELSKHRFQTGGRTLSNGDMRTRPWTLEGARTRVRDASGEAAFLLRRVRN